jgi:hypothetical protein
MTGRTLQLVGEVRLTNTKPYPFNDSQKTVALEQSQPDVKYSIQTEVISASGEVGDIEISGKAVNGFKIAYTGSALKATIRYYIRVEK